MPKNSRAMGPSIAGLTEVNVPSETEYTEAMQRHGTDKFTEDDAAVVREWLDHQARNFDPHRAPTEVEQAVAEDASAKAAGDPDAKGLSDRVLEGAQTSAERVDAKTKADEGNADKVDVQGDGEDSSTDGDKSVDNGPTSDKLPTKSTGARAAARHN